jgi:hypothetical protein
MGNRQLNPLVFNGASFYEAHKPFLYGGAYPLFNGVAYWDGKVPSAKRKGHLQERYDEPAYGLARGCRKLYKDLNRLQLQLLQKSLSAEEVEELMAEELQEFYWNVSVYSVDLGPRRSYDVVAAGLLVPVIGTKSWSGAYSAQLLLLQPKVVLDANYFLRVLRKVYLEDMHDYSWYELQLCYLSHVLGFAHFNREEIGTTHASRYPLEHAYYYRYKENGAICSNCFDGDELRKGVDWLLTAGAVRKTNGVRSRWLREEEIFFYEKGALLLPEEKRLQ